MKLPFKRFSIVVVSIVVHFSNAFSDNSEYDKENLSNIGTTVIKSFRYPYQYPTNYEKDWEIVQNFGSGLKVVFEELYLEKQKSHCFDKLYFTAKLSSKKTVDYKPCAGKNDKLPNNTYVFNFEEDSLIKLNINFKSDGHRTINGKERFKFTVIPICDKQLESFENGTLKTLVSPLFPNPYPMNLSCNYIIKASSDEKRIKVVLVDLNLSEQDDCNEDRLFIKDVNSTKESVFCNERNKTWVSKSQTAILNFVSYQRKDKINRTFKIEYYEISEFDAETPDFISTAIKQTKTTLSTTTVLSSTTATVYRTTNKEVLTNKITSSSRTTVLDPSNEKILGNDKEVVKEVKTTESSLTTVVILILLAVIIICATVVFVVMRLKRKPRESRFFDAPPVSWSANRSLSDLNIELEDEGERVRRENPYAEIPAVNNTNVYHGIEESMDEIDRIKKGLTPTTQVEQPENPPPLPGQHPSMKNYSDTFDIANEQPSTSNDFNNHHYGNIAPTCDESDDEVFNNVVSQSATITSPQNHVTSQALTEQNVIENPYVEDPTSATENYNGLTFSDDEQQPLIREGAYVTMQSSQADLLSEQLENDVIRRIQSDERKEVYQEMAPTVTQID